jgi:hypothetical protein
MNLKSKEANEETIELVKVRKTYNSLCIYAGIFIIQSYVTSRRNLAGFKGAQA